MRGKKSGGKIWEKAERDILLLGRISMKVRLGKAIKGRAMREGGIKVALGRYEEILR